MNANSAQLAIEQLQQGIAKQRAGQISAALSHYQRAAKLDPSNAQVWHLLGVCALQSGNLALAAKHFRTCLKLNPESAETYNNLGVALRRMGRHGEAVDAFRSALAIRRDYASAAYNLGLSFEAMNVPGEAENAYRHALQSNANDFNSVNALGNLLFRTQRTAEAVPLLKLARRLQPDNGHANGVLAQALLQLDLSNEALEYAQAAATIEPDTGKWWAALGLIRRLRHEMEPAIAALRRAIELDPADELSKCELGFALGEAGEVEEARAILLAAMSNEDNAERLRWAARLLLPSVYASEAEVDAERLRLNQGLEEIDAKLALDTPHQLQRTYHAVQGAAIFQLAYQARDNTALQYRFGALIDRAMRAISPGMQACDWQARMHGGRIRVGIVSNHLMHHTVSRYFRRLLLALDPERFEVHVWYGGETRDFSTEQIAARAASFTQTMEDPLDIAARIRSTQLDALIYPEIGMDPRHALLGSLRLAPVQAMLYGHPVTTGLANMDYFLSADALEPANAQEHYREKLIRLPGLGTLPERPPPPDDGAWLDAHAGGAPITLCLQNHLKLTPSFDDVLARVALESGARIGFFIRNTGVAQRFRRRIEAAFAARGLDPSQALAFLPSKRHEDYLGAIARATLILDTPGFSGGATSLDAFSAGAPVLTWNGTMARGRQTQGMLAMMGVDGLVAADEQDYVDKAVALIGDAPRREALRAQILEHSAVLFEDNGVTAAFADFLDTATRQAGV
ncbi:MAG: tetratricopeptide repeat protein [Rudaea sp.]|nr:tetratricopeptide repeat protein [Rudaea sp.]